MNSFITFALTSLLVIAESLIACPSLADENSASKPTTETPAGNDSLKWESDYGHAVRQATEEHKMLVIYFEGPQACTYCRQFEARTLSDAKIQQLLAGYVPLRLKSTAEIIVDGKSVLLLGHPSFAEMLRRPGVAILDLRDKKSPYFNQVVSVLPFTSNRFATSSYSGTRALATLLDLPTGTLTQRTMVFAVRMHPESPASTQGNVDTALLGAAKSHSDHQASIGVQGHHNWDSRFQQINAQLPSGLMAQEVVAESWPGESLVEAAEDCVHSWRQSPGHWRAVRSWQPRFGYDIKRGRNGIWYATGIFGRR
jgi:hypothetical protein